MGKESINIIMWVMMVNLMFTLFAQTQLIPQLASHKTFDSTESIDEYGQIANTNSSLAYKISYSSQNQKYMTEGVTNTNLIYIRSGGDFIKGLSMIYDNFIKGTVLLYPTLIALGLNGALLYIIIVPFFMLYMRDIISIISNREV
jgi:hypothetical protein